MSAEPLRERGTASAAGALLAGYRPLPGVHDELMDDQGRVRANWRPVIDAIGAMGREELNARFDLAERQLRVSGVSYHVYEGDRGRDRSWPLSPIPLVISASEWSEVAAGVAQRARLLEAVLADAYGPGDLVRGGALPAAVVAGSPEFLRPVHGVRPAGGRHLHLYAVDLARGADGRWWVLSDRTQAPSGAGYAVENRLAVSRAFPDLISSLRIERVSGFFRALRTGLASSARRVEPRIGLITPGPLNETYFEHSFLARYLGFLLVEGADLSVHNGRVYVGTVEGPRRVDILVRRVDSLSCDPVELDTSSQLGVPGLVQAVRSGEVVVANALGSGVVEAPALLGFLPALAPRLLGENLKLSNLATWWCGQERERKAVLAAFDERVIAPAFEPRLSGRLGAAAIRGRDVASSARAQLIEDIKTRGLDFVGQEAVKLSTMPVWEDGRLVPRPFALRVFVAMGPDGPTVMPGGLARIAGSEDVSALSMQRGGRSADVWVVSEQHPTYVSLLPQDHVAVRRGPGQLPSRVADHLFWLGRYVERAEAALRLARAYLTRRAEVGADGAGSATELIAELIAVWSGAKPGKVDGPDTVRRSLYDVGTAGSAPRLVRSAVGAANIARDRLPPEAWRTLVQLDAELTGRDFGERDAGDRAEQALRRIAAVVGLTQENMTRGPAWYFLDLGRRIERGVIACRFARVFGADDEGLLDVLLDLADCQMSYRRRYLVGLSRVPVIDLVVLDPANPRSAAFQVARIVEDLSAVAPASPHAPLAPLESAALSLSTMLRTASARDIDPEWLIETENSLMTLSNALSERYLIERPPTPNEPLLFT